MKPCPFCGSSSYSWMQIMCSEEDDKADSKPYFGVTCSKCGACGPTTYVSKQEAEARWDTRV